jgi:hypothetical protein
MVIAVNTKSGIQDMRGLLVFFAGPRAIRSLMGS